MSERLAQDIAALVALFKEGGWQELRVEGEGLSLLLSTDPGVTGLRASSAARPEPVEGLPSPAPVAKKGSASTSSAETEVGAGPVDPAWHAVVAPNLGTFYRSPKPGAAPFVEVGDRVTADTEICLLEVMKLFTSVKAGVSGTIAGVVAADAELVEGGQTLFHINPD